MALSAVLADGRADGFRLDDGTRSLRTSQRARGLYRLAGAPFLAGERTVGAAIHRALTRPRQKKAGMDLSMTNSDSSRCRLLGVGEPSHLGRSLEAVKDGDLRVAAKLDCTHPFIRS
jgi:hypothetical protein